VRPAYNIADLLVDTPYQYWFRAFSQPTGDDLTDLYHDSVVVGVTKNDQSKYYRHFLTEKVHTIRVTLERLEGKGLPKLMVKFANERVLPSSDIPESYDGKVELKANTNSVHIDMTKEQRY